MEGTCTANVRYTAFAYSDDSDEIATPQVCTRLATSRRPPDPSRLTGDPAGAASCIPRCIGDSYSYLGV